MADAQQAALQHSDRPGEVLGLSQAGQVSDCEARGDQQRTQLVAVQPGGVGLVIQTRTADVHRRGMVQQFFLDGVLVEPGNRGQAAGGSRSCAAPRLEISREALDIGPTGLEEA